MADPAPTRSRVSFTMPDGSVVTTPVSHLLNAGYAGRDQTEVRAHIDELAAIGVPAPSTVPTLYPVAPYLAQQVTRIDVQHTRTSGEAEWALVLTESGALLTVACDHTDRELEAHGVAWSKNASPDVLASSAWPLADVASHLNRLRLRAEVRNSDGEFVVLQDATLAALLTPDHWLTVLTERGLNEPGTILLSGTVPMIPGVDQFAEAWRVTLVDPVLERSLALSYDVVVMPEAMG